MSDAITVGINWLWIMVSTTTTSEALCSAVPNVHAPTTNTARLKNESIVLAMALLSRFIRRRFGCGSCLDQATKSEKGLAKSVCGES